MPVNWMGEAFDYPADPETGVTTCRLTTTLKHHVNVYCEHSFSSPSGKRIAILRSDNADPRTPPFDLLVADLDRIRIRLLERDCASIVVGTASWSGWIYYLNKEHELMRVNLETLDKEVVWTNWEFSPDFIFHTVSPDLRYMVGQLPQRDYNMSLVRIDLVERKWEIIYQNPEISNAHPLFNPIHGRDISVMMSRGIKMNDQWETLTVPNELTGSTHFFIDKDGGNVRPLPLGEPYTNSTTGHSNWLGDTGRLAVTVTWDYATNTLDPRWPQGNVFFAGPDDKEPRVFEMPEHRCNHIATSRCGRYFVADSYWKGLPGPMPLVVGNFETGKYRMLLTDCKAMGGASTVSHPHAYFTVDNKHVVYNADPTMIGHVYFARIPEGWLESLD